MTKTPGSPQYVGVNEPVRPPAGELAEFDAIYERDFDYVCRTLGRLGVPAGDIEDAMHEVFLVLYRRWNDIDRSRSLRPWLFGVARRQASDLRSKQRPTPSSFEPATQDPQLAQRDLLWRALDQLDDVRRIVVILHDLEGHTGAEIAEMLDVSPNTVHSRLRLARAELVDIIRKLEGA
ncbi:RNA polymerase sigma factor [soil metagenome]